MSEPDEIWARFKSSGRRRDRDALIEHYMPLLEGEARRLAPTLPRNLDRSELINGGFFGLVDAIEKFDPERGLKFTTYACSRIKGAILDSLRANDGASRTVRAQSRNLRRAQAELEGKLRRHPTRAEIAEEMGVELADLSIIFTDVWSLDRAVDHKGLINGTDPAGQETLADRIPDLSDVPDDTYVITELRDRMAAVIADLGEREQVLLGLHYGAGLTFAAISRQLGISEARVSQIHTQVMHVLRSALSGTLLAPSV